MNEINTGGPAFPTTDFTHAGQVIPGSEGMTLRDYFAAKAMQGFMNEAEDMHRLSSEQRKELWRIVTGYAYEIADAMLKARGE